MVFSEISWVVEKKARCTVANALENLLFDPAFNENWHMQFSERVALVYVLSRIRSEVSIEIGTFLCGSLRPISAASGHVYTFDIDDRTDPLFSNVSFISGDSAKTLPPVIEKINELEEELGFILVDGGHEENAVKNDIANCLQYRPKSRPTVILMHDSSNPAVRKGIIGAPWAENSHVHVLNLDFVPGLLNDYETMKGQIWGGFAIALMLPEKRSGGLTVQAPFDHSLSVLMEKSVHSP